MRITNQKKASCKDNGALDRMKEDYYSLDDLIPFPSFLRRTPMPDSINEIPSPFAHLWPLDPTVALLNHGSFGACPTAILEAQQRFRMQMEAEPVRFMIRELPELLDHSRQTLAELVGADSDNLAFVRNATFAVNSVLRSIDFKPGDEILTINQDYNACRNAATFEADRRQAKLVVAEIPFPIETPEEAIDAIVGQITDRTRLVMLDHVTSPTATVLPVDRIIEICNERGIDTLVDGSHAVGMLPLDLEMLGATYYTSNCHKWLCAPKGSAFLYVRPDRHETTFPASISHGYNMHCPGRTRLHDNFDWVGTDDPSSWLCVGVAIDYFRELLGDIAEMGQRNRRLAIEARKLLCDRLAVPPPCPDSMLGAMATLPLRADQQPVDFLQPTAAVMIHPLQTALLEQYGIEIPLFYWPAPQLMIRLSANLYNDLGQYERLAEALIHLKRQV